MKFTILLAFAFISLSLINACEVEEFTPVIDPTMSVSGSVLLQDNVTLPDSVRIYAVWIAEGDSADTGRYIWGAGTINDNNTFNINFPTTPIGRAMFLRDTSEANRHRLGVAYLMLLEDLGISHGYMDQSEFDSIEFYGAVGNTAIIYIENSENLAKVFPWADNFLDGYSVGLADINPDSLDGWKLGLQNNLILQITKDKEKISFPKWYEE